MPARARNILLFLSAAVLVAATAAEGEEQAWYLLLVGGKRSGTQTETAWRLADDTVRTELSVRAAVSRFSRTFAVTQRQSFLEGGTLLAVESETDMNGVKERLSARLEAGALRVVQERAGKRSEATLVPAGPLLGPYGLGERLRSAFAASEAELTVEQFVPETGTIAAVHLRLLGAGELTDSLGGVHRGLRVDQESSALPGITTAAVYDANGRLEYSIAVAGVALEQVRIRDAAAEGTASLDELELFDVASLSIPVRWAVKSSQTGQAPNLAFLRSVTVRFTGPALAELERAVQGRRDSQGLTVTFEAPPPSPAWPQTPGGEFTGDGFYLDLEDPRLEELLARCSPPSLACLERLVREHIRTRGSGFGFAGVGEVLDARAGDCTEQALLLAALLRRSGRAARVAYGFVLTEAGFAGHAWTEVSAGDRWLWLDPSFPGGNPYRFKLRLGAVDPALPVGGQVGVSLLLVAGGTLAEVLEVNGAR